MNKESIEIFRFLAADKMSLNKFRPMLGNWKHIELQQEVINWTYDRIRAIGGSEVYPLACLGIEDVQWSQLTSALSEQFLPHEMLREVDHNTQHKVGEVMQSKQNPFYLRIQKQTA